MNRDAKIYLGGLGMVAVLYGLSQFISDKGLGELFIGLALVTSVGLIGKFVQDKKLTSKLNSVRKNNKGGIYYSTDECKEIAKEWAKNNFHGKIKSKKGVSFDWTQSSTDPANIYDFVNKEWIHVRYFYSPYGPQNKGVFIYVDATNGQHFATKPVKKHEMKDNPYEYLEMYHLTKRFAGRISMGEGDQQFEGGMAALQGIPIAKMNNPGQEKGDS